MKGRGESFWQEARRAYENGEGSYQALAKRFGVSPGAMANHGRIEGWNRRKQRETSDLQTMTGKLSRAAMREIGRLEEGETDVKTIRELTALIKELNLLMKSGGEAGESTVRVQWEEGTEQWSE